MIHVQRSLARAFNKFLLVESGFWIHGPEAADTSYSERLRVCYYQCDTSIYAKICKCGEGERSLGP